jgi:hypothetical protein
MEQKIIDDLVLRQRLSQIQAHHPRLGKPDVMVGSVAKEAIGSQMHSYT